MAWKQVERNTIDIKAKNPGHQLVGTYTGFKKIKTELGENTIWQFQNEHSEVFGVYGFTNLNYQMEGVAPGTNCRLTYKGKSKTKNKFGKFPHQILVEVDTEDAPEAGDDADEGVVPD